MDADHPKTRAGWSWGHPVRQIKIKAENASNAMLKLLSKWIRKTASDVHNVVVGLILVATLGSIMVFANRILHLTAKVLNQQTPLWVTLTTTLGVLLLCLLALKKTLNTQKSEIKIKPEEKKQEILSDIHEKVLELLFQKPTTVENICKTLKLTTEEARYYLNDLHGMDMADPPAPYGSSSNWRIDQEGREYVMNKRKSA